MVRIMAKRFGSKRTGSDGFFVLSGSVRFGSDADGCNGLHRFLPSLPEALDGEVSLVFVRKFANLLERSLPALPKGLEDLDLTDFDARAVVPHLVK